MKGKVVALVMVKVLQNKWESPVNPDILVILHHYCELAVQIFHCNSFYDKTLGN